jgi:hypothetical protein
MIPITLETVIAAYDLLSTTPPFRGWNMPESDDVEFYIFHNYDGNVAEYTWSSDKIHGIGVNSARISTLAVLIEHVAHEMCHVRQKLACPVPRGATHGESFKKLAKTVCKRHNFDFKAF